MSDTVQQIKEKLSIVDVVNPYVKLTKAGRHWKGLSPFNKEKTPSFFVNPDRGSYYCFSSSQGGDMFTFVEKMEGVDFKGALKILAEKAGVPLEYTGGKDNKGKTDRLRDAMVAAEAYYARTLLETGAAYQYALTRGLSKETIAAWKLGAAPDAWRGLLEALTAEGFTVSELLAAGLIKEADEKKGTYYDRFRNRLMFPIRDSAGRTAAFTGRALDPMDQANHHTNSASGGNVGVVAKYLNSPETDLFKKSQVLFGMDRAKDAIRSRGFAILVEGQFDLILLHQIGFQNTIALSGTALSREHLSLIKRYADNLMFVMDADRAGLAASAKNAHTALSEGMHVKAVRLPLGKDPADLANETPQDLKRRIAEAESIVEFFLSVLTASEPDSHRLLLAVERTVLPLIRAMKSPLEREHFVGIVARSLASTPDAVRASLLRTDRGVDSPMAPYETATGNAPAASSPKDKRALLLRAIIVCYPETGLAKRVESEYARITGLPAALGLAQAGTPPLQDDIPEAVVFEAGLAFGESPLSDAADDLLNAFEQTVLADALAEASTRLRKAEVTRDDAAVKEALRDCKEIGKRLATFS